MPASLPGMSVTEAARLLQTTDRVIKTSRKSNRSMAKAGRAASATDPAPIEMFETVINLKPEKGDRDDGGQADRRNGCGARFLASPTPWTMPIKARIDMLSTGIRTPVGVKVFARIWAKLRNWPQIEQAVKTVPGTSSAYAERVTGGYYLDITRGARWPATASR